MGAHSNGHQILFLFSCDLIHLGDVFIGEFLDIILGSALIIFANLMVL